MIYLTFVAGKIFVCSRRQNALLIKINAFYREYALSLELS